MAHNFGLEAPICISKDSFEILRLSALIWAQTETLYAETGEKIVFEVYQWQFILALKKGARFVGRTCTLGYQLFVLILVGKSTWATHRGKTRWYMSTYWFKNSQFL